MYELCGWPEALSIRACPTLSLQLHFICQRQEETLRMRGNPRLGEDCVLPSPADDGSLERFIDR